MAKILITGGTGLIGKRISAMLLKTGHSPVLLSREEGTTNGIKKYKWDVTKNYIDERAFEGVEYVIHLAGAGIVAKRWTKKYKQEIIDSRVKSSALLFDCIAKHKLKIKSFVGGSATGYYGARQSECIFTEEDDAYSDFLGRTCLLWEQSYLPFIEAGIRTSIIRTGVVLSADGGAYKIMAAPFKIGLGTAFASGKQCINWIHLEDIASTFIFTLLNENISGTFNAVGSEMTSNAVFSKKLAQSLHKPFFLPNVPAFVLNAIMGESACTITEGVKISNQKIKEAGFKFKFENLEAALKNLADTQ